MKSLYVMEPGAKLVKEGRRVRVKSEHSKGEAVRPEDLNQCVLLGGVGLSGPAVQSLLRSGCEVVFLSRHGRFLGRLNSGLSKNVVLRQGQYELVREPESRLRLARRFVSGKLANQRRLLLRHQKRHPAESVARAAGSIRRSMTAVGRATDADVLRGVEGSAAAAYFGCWNDMLRAKGMDLERRIRRPPPDPVNVLLSFGYTLLGNLAHAAVEAAGLDPYLGCLHEARYGRPSLVLDLMEEFRPVLVDSAVLRAVNTRAVRASDFEQASEENDSVEAAWEREAYEKDEEKAEPRRPIFFTRLGVKKWLATWERRLSERVFYPPRGLRLSLRDVVLAQAQRFARFVEGEGEYESFEWAA